MNNEELIEERKRNIALEVIKSLDDLFDLTGETVSIKTTHFDTPKYKFIEVSDSHGNKIGINIHKLK